MEASVTSIYESGVYAENNPSWHEEDAPWKARQVADLIKCSDIPDKNIIEIGCGTGEILLNLERQFPSSRFAGYEISPQAFARAKSKETARTSFHLNPAPRDAAPEPDIALVIDVVEHVDDYMSFVRGVRSTARFKIFHIPLDLSVQSLFRRRPILRLRASVGHIHYFFKESALAMLEDCGYTILSHRYTASRLELPNQALSSRLMRAPRRALFAANPDFAVRLLGGYSLLVLAK